MFAGPKKKSATRPLLLLYGFPCRKFRLSFIYHEQACSRTECSALYSSHCNGIHCPLYSSQPAILSARLDTDASAVAEPAAFYQEKGQLADGKHICDVSRTRSREPWRARTRGCGEPSRRGGRWHSRAQRRNVGGTRLGVWHQECVQRNGGPCSIGVP